MPSRSVAQQCPIRQVCSIHAVSDAQVKGPHARIQLILDQQVLALGKGCEKRPYVDSHINRKNNYRNIKDFKWIFGYVVSHFRE